MELNRQISDFIYKLYIWNVRKNLIHKSLSFLLSVVVLLNVFVSSAWCLLALSYHHETSLIHDEVMQANNDELIRIPSDISSMEKSGVLKLNDHELLFNKKLYDIAGTGMENGISYYFCINDFKEEKILEQISQCTASHLDYYHSTNHGNTLPFNLFKQENASSCMNKKKLPETDFVFNVESAGTYKTVFLRKIFSPPEVSFS